MILGSDLVTGSSVVFEKTGFKVANVGFYCDDKIRLANAVAVSTAYPPYLSPVALRLYTNLWQVDTDADSASFERIRRKLVLVDGGMHDPLAVLPVFTDYATILVSDASQVRALWRSGSAWFRQLSRTTLLQTFGNSGVTREILEETLNRDIAGLPRGAFWCADRKIDGIDVQDKAVKDSSETASLCRMRTRLAPFTHAEQKALINWGYALCDAAMRKRFALANDPPPKCPVE